MVVRPELPHAVGRDGDPVLALLDLGRDPDDQRLKASRARQRPMIDLASMRRPEAMSIGTSSSATRSTVISSSSGLWAEMSHGSRSKARKTHDRSSEQPGELENS